MSISNHAVSKIAAATAIALSLAACGGGGGGATQLPNINPTNINNITPANTANSNAATGNTAASGSNTSTSNNSNATSTSTGSSGNNAAASSNSNVGGSTVVANPATNSNTSNNANTGTVNTAVDTAQFLAKAKAEKFYPVLDLKENAHNLLLAEYQEDGYRKMDSYSVTVGNKTYKSGNIDLSGLGNGIGNIAVIEKATATVDGKKVDITRNSQLHIYQQPYSIVAGLRTTGGTIDVDGKRFDTIDAEDEVNFNVTKGYATQTLPSSGKFNYVGKALTHEQTGDFKYTVDFAAKTGSGSISNIASGITLEQGNIAQINYTNPDDSKISGYGIQANARSGSGLSGTYMLGFFGPNADEVAGSVTSSEGDVGFGGKKQ